MSRNHVLTDAAAADLRAIIRYTRHHWGEARTRRYVLELEQGIIRLARSPAQFRDMAAFVPGLRMAHCGRHYIFGLPRPGEPMLIVAILHERMDPMLHLPARLP